MARADHRALVRRVDRGGLHVGATGSIGSLRNGDAASHLHSVADEHAGARATTDGDTNAIQDARAAAGGVAYGRANGGTDNHLDTCAHSVADEHAGAGATTDGDTNAIQDASAVAYGRTNGGTDNHLDTCAHSVADEHAGAGATTDGDTNAIQDASAVAYGRTNTDAATRPCSGQIH